MRLIYKHSVYLEPNLIVREHKKSDCFLYIYLDPNPITDSIYYSVIILYG
jgi:hypothetical protein